MLFGVAWYAFGMLFGTLFGVAWYAFWVMKESEQRVYLLACAVA